MCWGVIFHGQAFYFSKLEGNITLSSIVSYVATLCKKEK